MIFIKIIFLIIFLHQILFWTYFWQIKEYRLDRFFDSLKNKYDLIKTLKNQFNLSIWYRPKITLRALFSLLTTIFITIYSLFLLPYFFIFFIFLTPIITSLSIFVFAPIFDLYKRHLVKKATNKMANFKGIVIGITGSYGKSSTKEILFSILNQKYKVAKTIKNNNTEIGVTQTILHLKNNPEIFIIEMAAYKIGEIKAICNIVHPQIGIITGLGNQHLSLFGSIENIKKAKYELIKSLPKNGFGIIAERDFKLNDAQNIRTFIDHTEFDYQKTHFSVPLLGQNLIRNVIGAIKIAEHLNLSITEIKSALIKLDPSLFYPKLIKLPKDIFLVDDSYNSSVESFLSIIDYSSVYKNYRKTIITPGIIELGEESIKSHQTIGKKLKNIDQVIITNPQYFNELNYHHNSKLITSPNKLITKLKSLKNSKTVFIFKGRVPQSIINSLKND